MAYVSMMAALPYHLSDRYLLTSTYLYIIKRLHREVIRHFAFRLNGRLLDVDCGAAPYKPLFSCTTYIADGIREIVEDGTIGVLVPSKSSESLAEAIIVLLSDESRRRQMGEQARQRVSQMFSIQRAAAAVVGIYLSLLERKTRET
jgi:glycosyltransferase involved in cell wall biosynthesis